MNPKRNTDKIAVRRTIREIIRITPMSALTAASLCREVDVGRVMQGDFMYFSGILVSFIRQI
jgi:hypothetical protein